MYISDLALQGFKSFAYKTDVKFDQGITAIVGPNGCGKSNIVDSLRWVLGEQRPTLLRSSSMSNVIFNGTAKKNALGLAEVSLTFINNKGLLPTEYTEVTITRRLYRSGESEYLINGTKCRLKDIMELFMDTGMSSDAYSVIELKMVEEILTNKNNDRRRLFEEAAGVTGYKKKRKKTLRKLDSTQKDLQRVEDVVIEIRKKVRSLERQARKAKKSKEYREELELLDKGLSKYKFNAIQEELEPLNKRITNADKEKKEIISKTTELEQEELTVREQIKEKEQKQAEAQRRLSQVKSVLRETETNERISREKVATEKNIIDQHNQDIKQAETDLKELRTLFKSNNKQLDILSKNRKKAKHNLSDSKKKYNAIQKDFSTARKQLQALEKQSQKAQKQLSQLQNRRIKAETRLENTDEDIERIEKERVNLQQEISELAAEAEILEGSIEKAQTEHAQKEQALKQGRNQREKLRDEQNQLKDSLRKLQSRRDSVHSEIELLENIAQSNEAFPSSVKYLLENHARKFPLMEVVSGILSTVEEHAVALEAVLGHSLNYIVVESLADAQEAASLLKQEDKGKATFIPLELLSNNYKVHDRALCHKVKTESQFTALNKLLLGDVILADSVDEAYQSVKENKLTAVTLQGEVVTGNQFLQSGSTDKNAGMRVGLKDKIEKLEQKATTLRTSINEKEEALKKVRTDYDKINLSALEEKVNQSRHSLRQMENSENKTASEIQVHKRNTKELKERAAALDEAQKNSSNLLKKLSPQQKGLQQKIKQANKKQQNEKETLSKLEEERSIAQSRFNDARLAHQNLQNKVESHERDIKRAETGIQNLKKRLKTRSQKKEEARQKVVSLKEAIASYKEELQTYRTQHKEAAQQLQKAKEATAAQRGAINKIEKQLKEVRRQKEVNMELVHHLSMAKEKFELQAKNTADHVWETYEVLMDQLKAHLPEGKNAEEAKERIGWLRQQVNRIGEVNALAIDEFEEEKQRLDLYEEQIEDLEEARKKLQETIDEINKTATERFNKTFKEIRTNFKQVFHTLFNEDDFCDLLIDEDAEDPLEAKIDIKANPRGKRPSTINQLSGGEKTLTAIALLFAIYLVKPSPFCVLDEVDAPLDDANIERFSNMIKRFSEQTQFIIITHNKNTMAKAEMMYGVTMPETGISRLVGVKVDEVAEIEA